MNTSHLKAAWRWTSTKGKDFIEFLAGVLVLILDFVIAVGHLACRLFPLLLSLGLAFGVGGVFGVLLLEFNNNLIGSFFYRPFEADIENFTQLLSTGNAMFGYSGGIFAGYLGINLWKGTLKPILVDGWKYISVPFRRGSFGWFSRGVSEWAQDSMAGVEEPGGRVDCTVGHSWLREMRDLMVRVKDGPTLRVFVLMVAFTFALLSLIKAGETKGRSFSHLSDAVSKLEHSVRVLGLTVAEKKAEKKYRPFALNPPPKTVPEARARFELIGEQLQDLLSGDTDAKATVSQYEKAVAKILDDQEKKQDTPLKQAGEAIALSASRFYDGLKKPWELFRRIDSDLSAAVLCQMAVSLEGKEGPLESVEKLGDALVASKSNPADLGVGKEPTPAQQIISLAAEIDVLVAVLRIKHPNTVTGPAKVIERQETRIIPYPIPIQTPTWTPIIHRAPVITVDRDLKFTQEMLYHCFFENGGGDSNRAAGTNLSHADRANVEKLYRALRLQGRPGNPAVIEVVGFASSVSFKEENSRQNLDLAIRRGRRVHKLLRELFSDLQDQRYVIVEAPEDWGIGAIDLSKTQSDEIVRRKIEAGFARMEEVRDSTFIDEAALADLEARLGRKPSEQDMDLATMLTRRVDVRVTSFGMAQPPVDLPGNEQVDVEHAKQVHDAGIPRAMPVALGSNLAERLLTGAE